MDWWFIIIYVIIGVANGLFFYHSLRKYLDTSRNLVLSGLVAIAWPLTLWILCVAALWDED